MELDQSLLPGARKAVFDCLWAKPGETLLIVTDEQMSFLASHFVKSGREGGVETLMLEMAPRKMHGEEPPAIIGAALLAANCALLITAFSLTHTKARGEATKAGVRIASMPGVTAEMIRGPLNTDYTEIKRLSEKVAELLTQAKEAVIRSAKGTNLTLNLSERKALADTGLLHHPGAIGNLPAGEGFIAPQEGQGSGKVVIDGTMAGVGRLKNDIILAVENGKITNISGGEEAKALEKILSGADENAFCIAELGVGTNKEAQLSGNLLIDEKVYGTVHLAVGNNLFMGGAQNSKVHLDGVILEPTLILDGQTVIDQGRYVF